MTSISTATVPTISTLETKKNITKISKSNIQDGVLEKQPQFHKTLARITSHPTLTPFRRRVYRTLLCSVGPGQWTTYSALSKHLNSSPRAVGNAMKTNPFAPAVPCHRVLAMNGTLGGYKGEWNNGGQYSVEKMKLLLEEGVEFDGDGKAKGSCFVDFIDV